MISDDDFVGVNQDGVISEFLWEACPWLSSDGGGIGSTAACDPATNLDAIGVQQPDSVTRTEVASDSHDPHGENTLSPCADGFGCAAIENDVASRAERKGYPIFFC